MTGCRALTVTEVAVKDSRTGWKKKKIDGSVVLDGLEEINFEYCQLSPSQWINLLSRLNIPSLRILKILGETSMSAVYDFLLHHPDIRCLHFRKPSANDHPPASRRLNLPKLRSLQGSSSQILHLLQSLPSPPSIGKLVVEADQPVKLRRGTFVDQVMHCLALCKGPLALEITLPKERCTAGLMLDVTRISAAHGLCSTALPCIVSTFCIEFEGIGDEWILVRGLLATELVHAFTVSR